MKHIFEQAISNVRSAYPSIYTKEDVVMLINDLLIAAEAAQEESAKPAARDFMVAVKESLLEGVRNIDFEDCVGLELNYDNRIDIEIDTRTIIDEIDKCFEIAVTEAVPSPAE